MAKKNLYCVETKEKSEYRDCLWFKKVENGGIEIQLNSSTGTFSVRECKEIIDKLKKCILE